MGMWGDHGPCFHASSLLLFTTDKLVVAADNSVSRILSYISNLLQDLFGTFFGQLKVILHENGTKTVKFKFKTWFQRRHKS